MPVHPYARTLAPARMCATESGNNRQVASYPPPIQLRHAPTGGSGVAGYGVHDTPDIFTKIFYLSKVSLRT